MTDKDFPTLVAELLVMEYGKTKEEAERMCKTHTRVMVAGIMSGLSFVNIRATALAITMAEDEASRVT